jgi:hypothetical protein
MMAMETIRRQPIEALLCGGGRIAASGIKT